MYNVYSFLKVAGLCADSSACGQFRVMNPLRVLKSLGAKAEFFTTMEPCNLADYDIIIAQRQVSPKVRGSLKTLIDAGKTVIFEVDDLMDRIDPYAPAYQHYHNGSADLAGLKSIMYISHGITTSTLELAADSLKYSKNVRILPNMLDFTLREWPVKNYGVDDGKVRLGWTGSKSHIVDMAILGNVLSDIMARYPETVYVHYSTKELLTLLLQNYKIPADRVEFVEPITFEKYPQNLPKFDIGLIPVKNTPFGRAKSNLKALEYNAVGLPFVASKIAPYQRYCKPGVNGYLADTAADWRAALSELIESPDKRKAMGAYGIEDTRANWDQAKNIDLWVSAWSDIAFAAKTGGTGPGESICVEPKMNDKCLCGSGKKYGRCCSPAFG